MNTRGYQVVELLLVCLFISFLATLGVFSLQGISDQQRLHAACRMFQSTLAIARSHSISKNLPTTISIHPSRRKFTCAVKNEEPGLWQALPEAVEFSAVPSRALTFYSRGTAAPARSYLLENPAGKIKIVISPTGRVRWERIL